VPRTVGCLTLARTSQGYTALMLSAMFGNAVCVEALVAAKAALDIQGVSYARLFACPVTLILCLHAH
jgi:ankyrin repeat protein